MYSLYNGDLTHSIRKLALKSQNSWYFVHFCVSFMSMIFSKVLFNWAVKKRICKIFGFNALTKLHFLFYLYSLNLNFDICTSVGSWLVKITHLLWQQSILGFGGFKALQIRTIQFQKGDYGFSSPELKAHMSFSDCLSSVCTSLRLTVCPSSEPQSQFQFFSAPN